MITYARVHRLFTRLPRRKTYQAWTVLLSLLIFFGIISPVIASAGTSWQQVTSTVPSPPQSATPAGINQQEASEKAISLLSRLTPEEKVGQLFLVTFNGNSIEPDSPIYTLITSYHVGGVVLEAENDNFTTGNDQSDRTLNEAVNLIQTIQDTEWEASLSEMTQPNTGEVLTPAFIPLYIGISQEGDGYPHDQILNDLTPLPNQMTLGATWNTEVAREIGGVLGSELSATGINLLLGPSLDVLEVPQLDGESSLGTRTFGGDPYWVGEMGKAYIEGVHTGSNGRIAVISKHFPGQGGSDRLPEEEVSTVRKTLDQLRSFELVPFFTVTTASEAPESTTDGLLTSHIRYQGFQGNIRATTRPVSFDPQALNLLMEQPEFTTWRENGGIMVSDDLGSLAIRRFYELTNQAFDMSRRVALNAFLAGNDLLYIGDFSSQDLDSFAAAVSTLSFFAQKYREDPAFAQRVDESVLRSLQLKYRLYGDFLISRVNPINVDLSTIGTSSATSFEAARQAATLISPSQTELEEIIPDPPNQNDRIVIISDSRSAQQCSDCPEQPILEKRLLEETILRLYGPQAGGQVTQSTMISYTIEDLRQLLESGQGDFQIERSLERANWIIFALLDNTAEYPSYQTLKEFLASRPDLIQQKRLIVYAMNAPYYLDATNISKITAYYGLYSKINVSVDVAAYLLFKEQIAGGASPVSIPGVSYDINQVLFPNPEQVIPLTIISPQVEGEDVTSTPEPIPITEYRVGDIITVGTGSIYDFNNNPVPDGTLVEFRLTMPGEPNPVSQTEITRGGFAQSNFAINTSGSIEISAVSGLASSEVLKLDIPPILNPDADITEEPTPLSTDAPTENPTEIPAATETPLTEQITPYPAPILPTHLLGWAIALAISGLSGFIAYLIANSNGQRNWGARVGFLVVTAGMSAYLYLLLELPGTQQLAQREDYIGIVFLTLVGVAAGLVIAWTWRFSSLYLSKRAASNHKT